MSEAPGPARFRFDWDEANVGHIARHEVRPAEVEEVFFDPFRLFKTAYRRNGELRYEVFGETLRGRILKIVFTFRQGAIRTVTAILQMSVIDLLIGRLDVNKIYETMPDFASEQEEADWLDAHAEELDGELGEAIGSGTAMNAQQFHEMLLRDHHLVLPEAFFRVPLSNEDVAQAKAIATASGLAPEELLSQIVHEALNARRAA